ncbi:MAG TPA: CHAD domain-containing protein [Pirellulaceae bacterium]|nr:CHAD domain-containing protein [Pirellulaceae bacterium]HMO92420.1 CHAD domain-containing protein [Pirellulaceae bacterium]HMP69539.1 CHAD domain-containing protein [Pirellulaceae bacterium]
MKIRVKKSDLNKRSLQGRIARQLARLEEMIDGNVITNDQVHSMRRSFKKIRAMLRLLRFGLTREDFARSDDAVRACGKLLAPLRDAWVMENLLAKSYEQIGINEEERDRLIEVVQTKLPDDMLIIESTCGSSRHVRYQSPLMSQLSQAIEITADSVVGWSDWHVDQQSLLQGVGRMYQRGQQDFRRSKKQPDAEHFHTWRRRVKQLYFFTRLIPWFWTEIKPTKNRLKRLECCLGNEHDLYVIQEFLLCSANAILSPHKMSALLKQTNHRRHKLQKKALRIGKDVYHLPWPKYRKRELKRR